MEWKGVFPQLAAGSISEPVEYTRRFELTLEETEATEEPLPAILGRMANLRQTGRITITLQSEETFELTLITGVVQSFESDTVSHSQIMVELLSQLGQISSEGAEQLLEECSTLNQSAVRILVGRGDLRPREAVELIRKTFTQLMHRLLAGSQGSILFTADDAENIRPGPVPTPLNGILIGGAVEFCRNYSDPTVKFFNDLLETCELLLAETALPELAKWCATTPKDILANPATLPKPCSWKDLMASSGPKGREVLIAAFLTGKLTVASSKGSAVTTEEKVLPKLLVDLEKGDLYERLELHWTCHPDQISPSFNSRMSQLTFELEGEELRKAEQLLHESWNQLSTVGGRQDYRAKQYGDRLVRERGDFMLDQVKRNMLRAEWREAVLGIEAVMDMGIRTAEVLDLLDSANTQLRTNPS